MNTVVKQELTRSMKYCTINDAEDWEYSYDITDIAEDFPFASVCWNPKTGKHDVCEVDTCIEHGNEIRLDNYIAQSCSPFAIVALCQALHIKHSPMKQGAYRNLRPDWAAYDKRVRAYEAEGMTRSDAQGVVDAEDMKQCNVTANLEK